MVLHRFFNVIMVGIVLVCCSGVMAMDGFDVPYDASLTQIKGLRSRGKLLCDAAQKGDCDKIFQCHAAWGSVNYANVGRQTPLHVATFNGQAGAVLQLITLGAPVSATNEFKMTPLHFAAKQGFHAIVKILIDRHADRNIQNSDGKNALTYAQERLDMIQVNSEHLLANRQADFEKTIQLLSERAALEPVPAFRAPAHGAPKPAPIIVAPTVFSPWYIRIVRPAARLVVNYPKTTGLLGVLTGAACAVAIKCRHAFMPTFSRFSSRVSSVLGRLSHVFSVRDV